MLKRYLSSILQTHTESCVSQRINHRPSAKGIFQTHKSFLQYKKTPPKGVKAHMKMVNMGIQNLKLRHIQW